MGNGQGIASDRTTGEDDQTCVVFTNALHEEVRDLCALQWPEEACGLLIAATDTPNRIERVVFAKNVAEEPHTTFEIDPKTLIDCHRTALPSPTDRARADENGFLWLIIATEHNRAGDSGLYRIIHQTTTDAAAQSELRYFRRCQIIDR